MYLLASRALRLCGVTATLVLALLVPQVAAATFSGTPDDPLYGRQWALEHIGAPCAWQRTTGNQGVIVAVIDSGADMSHPDLVQRLRKDGFDFVDGDDDPSDENGHGTHVSGIVAATLNNAEGTAGLAPDVQILPIRVMSAEGEGSDRAIASGITYAVDKGAKVVNLSLGATLLLGAPESSPLISRAIRNALAAGTLVVAAAGNDFVPLPNAIVGENEDVLVVAASDRNDRKARFSNSGPWVDVTAPGERILSTMPTYEVYLTSSALPEDERFAQDYDYMSGTSQAAPYVAALAALVFSQHPEYTPAQVTEALKTSAKNIYPNHPSYFQRLKLLGSGRIDACAAVGGPATVANPLDALFTGTGLLALSLGAGGLCLLTLATVGVGVGLVRRRRRARTPAAVAQPAAVPPPPPPFAPVPSSAPVAQTGATLVATLPVWGRLIVTGGLSTPASFELRAGELIIGRSGECDLQLAGDPSISRRHARLLRQRGAPVLEDLGSSHGSSVNGKPVVGPTALRPGDIITLGQTSLRLEM